MWKTRHLRAEDVILEHLAADALSTNVPDLQRHLRVAWIASHIPHIHTQPQRNARMRDATCLIC